MIKMNKTAILLAFAAALCTVSCKKSDNTTPVSNGPVYQHTFDDEFNNDNNGWIYTDPTNNTSVFVGSGNLNYLYHPIKNTTHNFTYTVDPAIDTKFDFSLQTVVFSDNAMGLAFGISDSSLGYTFEIDNNGNYGVFSEGDSLHARSPILNWAKTGAAKPGFPNKLQLDQTNGVWYGSVNDVQVFSLSARALFGTRLGFVVEPNTNGFAEYIIAKYF